MTIGRDALDNPAARLHYLLTQAQTVPGSTLAYQGWRDLLVGQLANDAQILKAVSEVIDLAVQTERAVKSLDGENHEMYMRHFDGITTTMTNFFTLRNVDMQTFMAPCRVESLYSLEMCADVLHRRLREEVLGDDEASKILKQVYDLIEDVSDSAIEPALAREIIGLLKEIERAIEARDVTGARPVQAAADALAGRVTRARRSGHLISEGVLKGVARVIIAVDLALNLGANYLAIEAAMRPQMTTPAVQIYNENITNITGVVVDLDDYRAIPAPSGPGDDADNGAEAHDSPATAGKPED